MFKASLDTVSKIITASLLFFIILLAAYQALFHFQNATNILIPITLITPILLFTYLYSPYVYIITADDIIVHRKINNFFIKRSEIKSKQHLSEKLMGRAWRITGNGGLFGYTGYYTSSNIGRMRWFVRNRKNYVLIEMINGKKYVLSPDENKAFVKHAN